MMWDINVILFNYINHNLQNHFFNVIMPIMTHFGGFKGLFFILILIIVYSYIKKNNILKRIAILALISLISADVIALILKISVSIPRPFVRLDNVHLLVYENDPFSFPSGHTTSTFSVVTIAVLNMKDLFKRHYKIINLLLIIFAILIPFSRIYVGVHYPSDVLVGFLIGFVFAFLANKYKNEIFDMINI